LTREHMMGILPSLLGRSAVMGVCETEVPNENDLRGPRH
jgi:hypothetical protein